VVGTTEPERVGTAMEGRKYEDDLSAGGTSRGLALYAVFQSFFFGHSLLKKKSD
jgi:hypothetical protein